MERSTDNRKVEGSTPFRPITILTVHLNPHGQNILIKEITHYALLSWHRIILYGVPSTLHNSTISSPIPRYKNLLDISNQAKQWDKGLSVQSNEETHTATRKRRNRFIISTCSFNRCHACTLYFPWNPIATPTCDYDFALRPQILAIR